MGARVLFIAAVGVIGVAIALLSLALLLLSKSDLLAGTAAAVTGLLGLSAAISLVRLSLHAERSET